MTDTRGSTGLVSRPVPSPFGGPGNGAVESTGETLKGSTSRRETTGQGKTGRANASESSSRLRQKRHRQPTEPGDQGRGPAANGAGPGASRRIGRSRRHLRLRSTEDAHPRRLSRMRNTVTPMRSAAVAASRRQRRPEPAAGTGCPQKRMPAAERRGESITRRIGLLTSPKGR